MSYLKIKENVDLKELEKFGFVEENNKFIKMQDRFGVDEGLIIDKKTRKLDWNTYEDLIDLDWLLNAVFDLIKADLINKVEE